MPLTILHTLLLLILLPFSAKKSLNHKWQRERFCSYGTGMVQGHILPGMSFSTRQEYLHSEIAPLLLRANPIIRPRQTTTQDLVYQETISVEWIPVAGT
ncbi:hypothetical protein BDZ91DRAFT_722357 [Kalaharituber pfeilii]|nr:hypothetical protein BDZ91DRAFT_722357 [Kalaharituber pfeilii]